MIIPIGSCICLNFIQPFTENVNHCVNVFPEAFINIPVLYFPKYWSKKAFVKSLSGHELTLWNVVTTCHPNFQKKLFLHSSSWQPVLYITFPFEIWNDLDVHWLVHIFDVTLLECFNGVFFFSHKDKPGYFPYLQKRRHFIIVVHLLVFLLSTLINMYSHYNIPWNSCYILFLTFIFIYLK